MRKKDFKTSNKTFSVEAKRMISEELKMMKIWTTIEQYANSKKHSDLYTDKNENPKVDNTIHGLKFATVEDAEKSVRK